MAFWGVEVKPGKPFTHLFDQERGRLHISQATLGIGSSTTKSLVQCNVGDKSPVFLCALLPDKTESCHLDVEFEEDNSVIFSVIGPRSVHLTGYYLVVARHSNLHDDTDSYGEDIGNTETDASGRSSDEDEYEDSFIDDDNPVVSLPSPLSDDKVADEEMLDTKKPKVRKGIHKRLKKKYQSIESDDHFSPRTNIISCFSELESEDEDHFPIASLGKSRNVEDYGSHARTGNEGAITANPKNQADAVVVDGEPGSSLLHSDVKGPEEDFELKERRGSPSERKTIKADNLNCYNALEDKLPYIEEDSHRVGQDKQDQEPATDKGLDLPNHSLLPSDELVFENHTKSKKKRKERTKEGKSLESDGLKNRKAVQDKDQKSSSDKESYSLPYRESGSENGGKPKKRRKDCAAEGKSVEGANYSNVIREDTTPQNKDKSWDDHPIHEDQTFSNTKGIDIDSNQVADGDQPVDKKSKKNKKKSKHCESKGNLDIDGPLLPFEDKNRSSKGFEDKNVEAKPSQSRILSNGLIIEELKRGPPDGKTAVPGKKIKVHFVGKLKENGQIFDSNIGSSPFKFRLGAENVVEGWNIGLGGMRVGDKRRLIIPPSMGYGSEGAGENVPPNSYLVYEVELVGIH